MTATADADDVLTTWANEAIQVGSLRFPMLGGPPAVNPFDPNEADTWYCTDCLVSWRHGALCWACGTTSGRHWTGGQTPAGWPRPPYLRTTPT